MRGSLSSRLTIFILVLFLMLPASAAPRRNEQQEPGFLQRIVKIVKNLLPQIQEELSFPKP